MPALSRPKTAVLAAAVGTGLVLPVVTPSVAQAAESPTNAIESRAFKAVAPAVTPEMTREQIRAAKAAATRANLVRYAKTKLHHKGQYVAGASSENRFDCSGYTMHIYKKIAHINLPHFSGAQFHKGKRISKKQMQPGDLMFWGARGSQHVSMYIGHNKMIGANNPSRDVVVESINTSYWKPRYAGAVSLIKA